MSILFGHPGGNPNSHHAALAHFEAGRLEALCVPWMPSRAMLDGLECVAPIRPMVQRLRRRHFPPLAEAPTIQGRAGEMRRLVLRCLGRGDERLAYEANDWLMRTMRRECWRPAVRAVHAYEDCSLWQFIEAKRLGKACIYDLPIGYHPAWEERRLELSRTYADWLNAGASAAGRHERPAQKRQELELADLTIVPGRFVESTVRRYFPDKVLARAPYGVDLDFWTPADEPRRAGPLRFMDAGQLSLRKGIPLLIEAWQKAGLADAELELVGPWYLAQARRASLPATIRCLPPGSPEFVRDRYRAADVFVFPSYFEGFGLVMLEAMACGLPVIASDSTAGPDILTEDCGRLIPTGDLDALVEGLRWFGQHRERLPAMKRAARAQAERCTWESYRRSVSAAVTPFL